MKDILIKREQEKIKELAREYEKKGYKVYIKPTSINMPDFLNKAQFQPDLIATSNKENLVIEVKSSQSLSTIKNLDKISAIVSKEPGWDLILVLTNPKEKQEKISTSIDVSIENINSAFNKIDKLLEINNENLYSGILVIYLWSIIESILRLGISEYSDEYVFNKPQSILRESQTLGVISKNDYSFFVNLQELRNSLSHGDLNVNVNIELLKNGIETAKRIFSEIKRELSIDDPNYISYLKSLTKKELEIEIDNKLSETCYSLVDDESVVSETANTNAYAWDCEQYDVESIDFVDNKCVVSIVFYLSGEQDEDRFHFGSKITGKADVLIYEDGNIEYHVQEASIDDL